MKDNRPIIDLKGILATVVGGVMLMIATMFFQAFISSPPTRAEFNEFKAEDKGEFGFER